MLSKGYPYEGFYNKYYDLGGWEYNYEREKKFMAEHILNLDWPKNPLALEIGCGMGFHAKLLSEFGFRVNAIDPSEQAIKLAIKAFGKINPHYTVVPAEKIDPEGDYDLIFSRGASPYHYELTDKNRFGYNVTDLTKRMFRCLKEGGVFILQIRSDFTGTDYQSERHGMSGAVLNNKLSSYLNHFKPFGEVISVKDHNGIDLIDDKQAEGKFNILLKVRKI